MLSPPDDRIPWADKLRHYKLDGFVSWLLDAGRPLSILAAQALYLGQPFLGERALTLAQMLESEEQTGAFAALLNAEAKASGEKKT